MTRGGWLIVESSCYKLKASENRSLPYTSISRGYSGIHAHHSRMKLSSNHGIDRYMYGIFLDITGILVHLEGLWDYWDIQTLPSSKALTVESCGSIRPCVDQNVAMGQSQL